MIAVWIPVTVVPTSLATVAIDTFMTELSSVIRNCADASVSSTTPVAPAAAPSARAGPASVPRLTSMWPARSGRQDFCLLALELPGGDHPAVAQVGQLVRCAGRSARQGLLDVLADTTKRPVALSLLRARGGARQRSADGSRP